MQKKIPTSLIKSKIELPPRIAGTDSAALLSGFGWPLLLVVQGCLQVCYRVQTALGGNSIGFSDRLTDRLKMGDGLKMSDFGLGMS